MPMSTELTIYTEKDTGVTGTGFGLCIVCRRGLILIWIFY